MLYGSHFLVPGWLLARILPPDRRRQVIVKCLSQICKKCDIWIDTERIKDVKTCLQ